MDKLSGDAEAKSCSKLDANPQNVLGGQRRLEDKGLWQ